MVEKLKKKSPKKLTVDADIEAMSLDELQQWVMENRTKTRMSLKVFGACQTENCYYDIVKALLSTLTTEERKNIKIEKLNITRVAILWTID